MTARLNTMTNAAQRLNRSLDATDNLTDTIDPGAPFERSAADIGAASRQVDNFNNRQEQAERGAKKVKSVWSSLGGVIKSAIAAFSAKQVIELADSMTTTRARLDLMNDGLQTTAELQDMIMESANRSRAAKVFLSLYPADHPADATLHVEVTNNPFDDSPVWEDITSKVGKFVHTFANTTVTSPDFGLAYRFYMTKGSQEIEVIQATVRFA